MPEYPDQFLVYPNLTKRNPKGPDFSGKASTVDGKPKKCAIWQQPGRDGIRLLVKIQDPYRKQPREDRPQQEDAPPANEAPAQEETTSDPF